METGMWESAAVRANRETLAGRGILFLGPEGGSLASGHEGIGRMSEPAAIVSEALRLASGEGRDLTGLRVLITAGPTREAVDPIRFLSNRSSGKMGYELAEAARDRGAAVTLVSGPTGLTQPQGVRFLSFESAADLHGLLIREFPDCDVLVMAAAVADFIPEASRARLHRADGPRSIRLAPGQDLLASLQPLKRSQTVVAFAAETEDLEARGRRKMEAKKADLIVVNDVGREDIAFESAENEVLILGRAGESERVSRRGKRQVADRLWDAFLRAVAASPAPR
jgi:phosphopantothenoylcysteine decarboxylase/phosphopantothenate--cysteine ligase